MQIPQFSVIIPAYNRRDLTSRAIQSVLDQNFKSFEIILVDDASIESFDDLVLSFSDLRLRLIRLNVNVGGAEARNIGIRNSRGLYVAFLDSDDYWEIDKLSICHDVISESLNKPYVVIHSTFIKKNKNKILTKNLSADDVFQFSSFLEYIVCAGGILQTSALVVESELIKSVEFDSSLKRHQDLDLYIKLNNFFRNSIFINKPLSTWDISHEKSSISRESHVENSLSWIKNKKSIIGNRIYYSYVLIFVYSRNKSSFFGPDFKVVIEGIKNSDIRLIDFIKHTFIKYIRMSL